MRRSRALWQIKTKCPQYDRTARWIHLTGLNLTAPETVHDVHAPIISRVLQISCNLAQKREPFYTRSHSFSSLLISCSDSANWEYKLTDEED